MLYSLHPSLVKESGHVYIWSEHKDILTKNKYIHVIITDTKYFSVIYVNLFYLVT